MPETQTHFQAPIGLSGDYLDVRFVRDGKQIVRFTIRGVARIDGEDHDVVRFDTAHGFAHSDLLDWSGQTIRKIELGHNLDFAEALTRAVADLRSQWATLRADFIRRRP